MGGRYLCQQLWLSIYLELLLHEWGGAETFIFGMLIRGVDVVPVGKTVSNFYRTSTKFWLFLQQVITQLYVYSSSVYTSAWSIAVPKEHGTDPV